MSTAAQESQKSIDLLQAFCVNNPDLEQLHLLLSEFNIFEAAGLVREEIRHSKFLSFLLDPKETHGLGTLFLTRLLQRAVANRKLEELPVHALDLELMDLSDAIVLREQDNIDVLVTSAANKFAVVLENKVGSGEHSDQLMRYLRSAQFSRPGWTLLPILLSPEGVSPSSDSYLPVSYSAVAELIEELVLARKTSMSPDLVLVLTHYERLLRRHIVQDAKLDELCKKIVSKHRKAIQLLSAYIEDPSQVFFELTDRFFEASRLEFATDRRWIPVAWKSWVPEVAKGEYMLGFYAIVKAGPIRVVLVMRDGPDDLRKQILETAWANKHLFKPQSRKLYDRDNMIFAYQLRADREVDGNDRDQLQEEIINHVDEFIRKVEQLEEVLRPIVDRYVHDN